MFTKPFLFLALFLALVSRLDAQSTVTRSLSAFDKISISGGFDKVLLKEGNAESVDLEVEGIDADKIKTEVTGNTLRIDVKNAGRIRYSAKLTITYRNLEAVSSSGSCHTEALSVLKGERFTYSCSGSGDFVGTFQVKSLEASISGSGDLLLKGEAKEQDFVISGSGDINASSLKGDSAKVSVSGSGDVSLQVDGPVRSAISGSGKVTNKN